MAQCRSNAKIKESLRPRSTNSDNQTEKGDHCFQVSVTSSSEHQTAKDAERDNLIKEEESQKVVTNKCSASLINLRSVNRLKADSQPVPDVEETGISPTTHSIMKTKQAKEDLDKGTDEEVIEPKTRARKKASDINEEDKNKSSQDEPKTSKDPKKTVTKSKIVVKKRPLGIRKTKTLRPKKSTVVKKKVIRQTVTRARKAAVKSEPSSSQDKEAVPIIPASEIKKEPVDEPTPSSRSSSPKTSTRKPRLSSDMVMMKAVLGDSSSTLVLGPRTSPYSMRSERSNSPSLFEGKNLRSGKPRKVKNNLLNEIVIKEQKKRRRLLSDSKTTDSAEISEDCKKLKRGRSCSRDGSEISKCSDITESDISLNEGLNDTEVSKELNKKLDKSKTDLDIDIENNVQISTIGKVPCPIVDSKLAETKLDTEPSSITSDKKKKKLSLVRSSSLDSDNNNSNRLKLDSLNTQEIEEKLLLKTENDTLFEERSSILNCMSKTFNSKEVSKNIRRARRGKKREVADRAKPTPLTAKNGISSTMTNDSVDEKQESIDTLTKEINDLIYNLDQNIDQEMKNETSENSEQLHKPVSKLYGPSKPLGDNNSIIPAPDTTTPIKDKDTVLSITNESTPSKNDDSENIRLHYDEDSVEKSTENREISYKHSTVASIDKLMDRLKEFEEFDKRRQRQESESKSSDTNSVMVTSEVVLVNKSGADIKPLKDIQSARSPEKVMEKENVLSCFENNSAISIVKRDQVRKSVDIDLPNSVTLIKRNSFSARKESTSSNHSKESTDAISIFEKSLGKDVTLTEIRKSVDKAAVPTQLDLHQFTNPQQPETPAPAVSTMMLNSNQISITPRVVESKLNSNEVQITKRKSRDSISRKSSESGADSEDKAVLEKIRSPPHQIKSPAISITPTPVAVKSPEAAVPMETEALAPPLENVKDIPEDITLTSEVPQVESTCVSDALCEPVPAVVEAPVTEPLIPETAAEPVISEPIGKIETPVPEITPTPVKVPEPEPLPVVGMPEKKVEVLEEPKTEEEKEAPKESAKEEKAEEKPAVAPPVERLDVKPKSPKTKSARNSTENQAGPSTILLETPESQRRKENVLRTLGLLTHKAANEAKMEKMKQKERIYGQNYCGMVSTSKGKTKSDYTGTLKTVIKLNRTGERDKKKYRSSLKMTFQKSKNRSGKPQPEVGEAGSEDDAYYTIEKREGGAGASSDGGHRKSHNSNRLNNHDGEAAPEPEPKDTPNLVIPEKASSFSIHPGRLCMDQCFYCGGKFGLYDTPCHIAQMKSSERQKKVLTNEEKLTIDSCLCDACYRHVDRRANCPSYRKRPLPKQPSPPAPSAPAAPPTPSTPSTPSAQGAGEREKAGSPGAESESEEEAAGRGPAACHTQGCAAPGDHSIRRKWLIKMRSSVSKLLTLQGDYPGLHTIPLCAEHYGALAPLLACALCRRRLTKHHNLHFIHHGYTDLNPLLRAAGVPVQFSERPVLCKVCRYYCTLLQRPGHNDKHAHAYRRRLLQIHNVEIPPELEQEAGDSALLEDCTNSANKQRKKARTKSKQRRSTDPEKPDSESSERTTESSSPEKEKAKEEEEQKAQPIEEDIESLISSNKIPVPGAKQTEVQSEFVESEMMFDPDLPLIPVDKQTELQYLLQKQNNPAQFLAKPPNLTQKHKNILKIHNIGITKPSQQHKIVEKNAKRVQKIGQIIAHKDKTVRRENEMEIFDPDMAKEVSIVKNIPLNDECTIESIPNKKPADINTLKNKWQMSESFSQVKKNLSELSKKLPVEKDSKKVPDTKYSNPVKRLETNPSISVRELFPGEEEMNLQCNIEFNNVKGVTPEGWEKCNTMIQYDLETKRLWNELQRPYGNQSSFLRHLILLEKYFRSGDLVLSHNASPHAANYSMSVQSRLRAYDNVPPEPKRNEPSVSLIEFRKKPNVNSKSLLKSNQGSDEKTVPDAKKFMPPPGALPKKTKNDRAKAKALPPELIAITPNVQGRKAIQNVLQNIQQLVKGVSASDPTEVASAPVPTPTSTPSTLSTPTPETPKEKKEMPALKAAFEPPKDKKDLPPPKYESQKEKKEATKTDTPKKQKNASKAWRPTLLPITPENLVKIARDPLRIAVDGHKLPSLVQVLSSGERYHITFEDYNKMCIVRKERQQRLQEREAKNKRRTSEETTVVTEIQPSAMLGNGGTVVQNITTDKDPPELHLGANAATILKNVGLKNITIAPIPPKTSTATSTTPPAALQVPAAGKAAPAGKAAVGEAGQPPAPALLPAQLLLPKIPKSLTVIPQSVPEPRP